MRCRLLSPPPQQLLLLLCWAVAAVQPSRALFGLRGQYLSPLHGGGGDYGEVKVPMTVVVPDYSPRPAPFAAPARTPAPAVAPVPGSEDDMPMLPSERRSAGREPSGGNAGGALADDARAPAPVTAASGGASTTFISSSPAVPLPAGVTDSATVLPMPTPGQERQVMAMGSGTLLQARKVPFAMMLSFGALW
ncbi:hypothetical protein ABZP36_003115 [Zizania latifolia]